MCADNRLQGPLDEQLTNLAHVDTAYFDGNPGLECPLNKGVAEWLQRVSYAKGPC